jgi:DNA (cytosine-5)-methyltransferase 1
MRHGSLFSGIGGFDLAAQWMGWENVFHCEFKEFNQTILKYYWPNAISYSDIRTTDFTIHRGKIDILTGGFPCQPYSVAGKRQGTEDDRHLWPEMLRAVREIQPTWIVGENVRGLVNWSDGLVFEEVQAELEAEGYEVQPVLLPAAGVGAPHERYRIWIVAYSNIARTRMEAYRSSGQRGQNTSTFKSEILSEGDRESSSERTSEFIMDGDAANSNQQHGNISRLRTGKISQQQEAGIFKDSSTNNNKGLQRSENKRSVGESGKESEQQPSRFLCSDWQDFPTVSPVCNGNDGFSERLDGIAFSKWRNESIQAGGNAIVPQVALQIFKSIDSITLNN